MTLYVPAPENEKLRLTNLYGEAMMETEPTRLPDGTKNPDAGKERPALYTYERFLLDRTRDEKFCGKKEGLEALELRALARKQIAATVGVRGAHAFDNEVANRLRECILRPTAKLLGNVDYEHNWIEWALLWKAEPKDTPPAVLALPAEPDHNRIQEQNLS